MPVDPAAAIGGAMTPVHHRLDLTALLVPGRGVARVPHLAAFLPDVARIDFAATPRADTQAVAGWGFKPTAAKARAIAAQAGLSYIALEDAFLRSVGLGEAGAPPLSIVADDLGIYYDARQPSRIEALLQDGGWVTPALLDRAARAMALIVETGLSKTNAAPPLAPGTLPPQTRHRILVVDQTAGDASITGGLADSATFARMVAAARADNPAAEIIVRRHPAVAAGLKRGAISSEALTGVTLLDVDARAADILAEVDEVYCVTSLMGFEALMRGLPVRCFGMPFYAGWGATRDEIAIDRRTARRSVTEIFAAAFLLYARYVDPITGRPTTLEETIERLALWRDGADANAGPIAAIGFRPWKRAATRNLLASPRQDLTFHPNVASAAATARAKGGRIMIWSGKESRALSDELAATGLPVLRMEDGFVRSRGLGSDFHLPASVVLDDLGIYYDRGGPSRLEVILEMADMPPALLARAAALRQRMVAAGLSKYNVGRPTAFPASTDRFRLLVVGQVEDDRSIERGTAGIRTNLALLEAARRDHPDGWIAYKPHPDVEAGNRAGAIPRDVASGLADHIADHADISACLDAVDGLATMTSLAGFEALQRGKRVWTYGGPFYAGWGLTKDRLTFARRTRHLTLDMLVAGTLILYPRYVHPPTRLPCTVEEVVAWLADTRDAPTPRRWRWLRALAGTLMREEPAKF
ncbi:capsular polysaccharide biosynthesis protein [Sphingomonas sp. ID0503]|uniref:capsular polysaccharide biosynthesis protein n=1 Tax=Sphingomonas sp. ID0503 TaxID=3399691 RepID=UPI003AFA6BA8